MSSHKSITAYLLDHPDTAEMYKQATQCRFLELAGQGRLPKESLSQWLSQDRLYAQAYCRFIGGLISRVQLPVSPATEASRTTPFRILLMLQTAMIGVTTELQFFEQTAKEYQLDLAAMEDGQESEANKVTKACIDLFDSFTVEGGKGRSLLQGLVMLWALEKVYLDAWTFAKQQSAAAEALDGGALRNKFIPNWAGDQFRAFVNQIQECLDAYASNIGAGDIDKVAMDAWKEMLMLEEGFWPRVQ
ncbi:heme oxygenase-like protein [Apiospora rasikravindrae]|uniref:Heme oxygenase-like protein n=1 Tax=Apiospora rasikravindrae TaxID=990691 RepID=A0ABR1UBV6_9PEZI